MRIVLAAISGEYPDVIRDPAAGDELPDGSIQPPGMERREADVVRAVAIAVITHAVRRMGEETWLGHP